ncbi:MAG: cytochrome C oxidase subunit IV family protein [Verrucomicrobiales bacterium]
MSDAAHDWGKHKKTYTAVGLALFVFTGITLLLGIWEPLDFGPPGPTPSDFVLGLGVAGTKASLVALIFMHLNHERGLVYKLLLFTFIFFVGMMSLTLMHEFDPIDEQFGTLKTTKGRLTEEP